MGNIFSVSCSADQDCLPPVWGILTEHAGYISKFDDNLDDLKNAWEDLKAKRDDVLSQVNSEELKGRRRLAEVVNWLSKVQTCESNTNLLVAEASPIRDRLLNGFCSNNIISTYCCGKKIPEMSHEVKSLKSEGDFRVVSEPAPHPVVEKRNVQETFGLDTLLEKTWKSLMDDENRMLGIYGMGGLGKTTLLTLINNKFVDFKDDFDVVIWVRVSRPVDIAKIQDDIGKRVGLYDENWCKKPEREKASDIDRVLRDTKPRFVLLLDELWEQVSLADIGVPPLQEIQYKVVFTTRSKDVCEKMEANENIKVECLAEEVAWDLFKHKAKGGRLSDEISVIAKQVAAICCGLPLALVEIGKSLSTTRTVDDWRLALSTLESSPSEWKDTATGIFEVLKLSYYYLGRKDAQLCFQYCALFPKEYNIKQDEMVEYWIGEGIIEEDGERQIATNRGYGIINTLVGAGLLLEGGKYKEKVYMHDMMREMALWTVSKFDKVEKFVVKTGVGLRKLPKGENWREVTKISVMNNGIERVRCDSDGKASLITLFLQNNKLVNIAGKFFVVMSGLVVLDLSRNPSLTELPQDLKKLVALRYLNLSKTGIKELPEHFEELRKLVHLDLESTPNLQSIDLVSRLWKLQVLRFYGSKTFLDRSLRKIVECLSKLESLTTNVREVEDLKGFLRSKLAGKTQGLYLQDLEVSSAVNFGELGSLGKLEMVNCDIMESEWKGNKGDQSTSSNPITPSNVWFKSLSAVVLVKCKKLKDVTWLMFAANLESLSITLSPKMEQVISEEKTEGVNVVEPFQKLQVLDLGYLGELKSIYGTSLLFPKLKKVNITACPKLRKLPLSSTSVVRIDDLRIQVDEGWLDGAEWESEAAKARFKPLIIRTAPVS